MKQDDLRHLFVRLFVDCFFSRAWFKCHNCWL